MRVRRGSLEPLGLNAELRRTLRVLGISPTTVMETLKKSPQLKAVNDTKSCLLALSALSRSGFR